MKAEGIAPDAFVHHLAFLYECEWLQAWWRQPSMKPATLLLCYVCAQAARRVPAVCHCVHGAGLAAPLAPRQGCACREPSSSRTTNACQTSAHQTPAVMFAQLVPQPFPCGRVTLVTDMTGLTLAQVRRQLVQRHPTRPECNVHATCLAGCTAGR
jgi:hypothetical protein